MTGTPGWSAEILSGVSRYIAPCSPHAPPSDEGPQTYCTWDRGTHIVKTMALRDILHSATKEVLRKHKAHETLRGPIVRA